jgi:hypothetical protein
LPRNRAIAGVALLRRIGQSWRIELDHLEGSRSASGVRLGRDIRVSGNTDAAGSAVDTRLLYAQLRIIGGYSLVLTPEAEFGLNFGGQIHRYDFNIIGQVGSARVSTGETDANPVAVAGFYGTRALTEQLRLKARAEFGRDSSNAVVGLDWKLGSQASVGVTLRWLKAAVDKNRGSLFPLNRSNPDFSFVGPQLELNIGF